MGELEFSNHRIYKTHIFIVKLSLTKTIKPFVYGMNKVFLGLILGHHLCNFIGSHHFTEEIEWESKEGHEGGRGVGCSSKTN